MFLGSGRWSPGWCSDALGLIFKYVSDMWFAGVGLGSGGFWSTDISHLRTELSHLALAGCWLSVVCWFVAAFAALAGG